MEYDLCKWLFHYLSSEAHGVGGTVLNEARNVVCGNEFVHIETNDMFFAVEIDFGKGFGELGFADASRTKEKKSADGTFLIFDAGTSTAEGIRDGGDGFFLVDHVFMDEFFEI